ncbi:hypothetical protein GJ496_010299 [Pomphorhynchus laevis]|nr:hypothetical protein GJ496_010299 [Pomphorhynchus laevis]
MPSTLTIVATTAALGGAAYYIASRRSSPQLTGALKGKFKPISLKLMSKEPLTHDTMLFSFALPQPDVKLGLPIGQFIFLKHESLKRPYTPISHPDTEGTMNLAIKVYKPSAEFPKGGVMSQTLNSLDIGSEILAFGPIGMLTYIKAPGVFEISKQTSKKTLHIKELNLIAGGSGITPMFQMIRAILTTDDSIHIKLVFANKTVDDIILKSELDALAKKYPEQLSLHYVITRQQGEDVGNLYFTKLDMNLLKKMLSQYVGRDDVLVAVCGPQKMVKETCLPSLNSLGFKSDNIYQF